MPLTDKEIRVLKPADTRRKYFDGGGLYLEVSPAGGKWWRLKYYLHGKDKRISLGVYPEVSLKDAREKAAEIKAALRKGIAPETGKKDAPCLFRDIAIEWQQKQQSAWTEKHARKVQSFLAGKVFSSMGAMEIGQITPAAVLALCQQIERDYSAYMAHVILSLISRVMRYAVACGYVPTDPCRDLRGALTPHKEKHMPAIVDPGKVGVLLLHIDNYQGSFITRSAMQIMLLCMCRTIEVRGARWEEVDLDGHMWRIPAARMKMRREHLVPLSRQAKDILLAVRNLTGDLEFVFPSCRSKSRQMSENTINMALRSMGYDREEIVGHGFRSIASTLLNELGWPADVIEAQLAHASQGNVRAAYNRAVWLDERRRMLQAWADYLDKLKDKARRS